MVSEIGIKVRKKEKKKDVSVSQEFVLQLDTLFLTVWLIDKYLSLKKIKRNKLQLIGVTCMLIACKYEEIYSPEIFDFVYITENSYEKKDIIELELEILTLLDFNIITLIAFVFISFLSYFQPFPVVCCNQNRI